MIQSNVIFNSEENRYEFLLAGFLVAHVPRKTYEALDHEQRKELCEQIWAKVFEDPEPLPEDLAAGHS